MVRSACLVRAHTKQTIETDHGTYSDQLLGAARHIHLYLITILGHLGHDKIITPL